MKRLLPLLLCAPLIATAQPVIQYGNVHLLGTTYPLHLVTNPGASDPDQDGANVTWDFSSATLTLNAGSTSFVAPSATPYAASYPTSNLAQSITTPEGTEYTYFNLQATQLDMLAQGIGSGDETVYTDPKTPLQFPFAFNDWFIDYYEYDGTEYSVSRAYMGYGTVILPTGTYTNVVKLASTSGAINFFRTNPVAPLVNIEDDGTAVVFGDPVTGLNEGVAQPALACFPNPTAERTNIIGLNDRGSWQLVDAQGRVAQSGRHMPGVLQLDLSVLAAGPYMLLVSDAFGGRSVKVTKL